VHPERRLGIRRTLREYPAPRGVKIGMASESATNGSRPGKPLVRLRVALPALVLIFSAAYFKESGFLPEGGWGVASWESYTGSAQAVSVPFSASFDGDGPINSTGRRELAAFENGAGIWASRRPITPGKYGLG
jgi:hypothetical protein